MIGIIGGVGPTAGADLLQKITEETVAANDQEHLPVILFSLPGKIKDRTEFLEGKIEENPGAALASIAVKMAKIGVTVAAIPCNTAHAPAIFSQVEKKIERENIGMQLVNMIVENINYLTLNFKPGTKIGVLSTTGTYRQKIYQEKLEKAGFTCVLPTEKEQCEMVHPAIYDTTYGIKTRNGRVSEQAKTQLDDVLNRLIDRGAVAIILGCTELPLAYKDHLYKNTLLVDATRILARALITRYNKQKLQKDSYASFFG